MAGLLASGLATGLGVAAAGVAGVAGVVVVGAAYVDIENWTPFLPNGFGGVMAGVSAVFFAYIGFDAV
ncbi:MAG: hypothetical protein F9K31_10955, partial [Dokdonella sp.]